MRRSAMTLAWCVAAAAGVMLAGGCGSAADTKARPSQGEQTKLIDTYKEHTDAVLALAINPLDPNEFISGGRDKSPERDRPLLRVWDFAAGKQSYAINYLLCDPIALSYSSDGRYLIVCMDNVFDKFEGVVRFVARVQIWDARRGRMIKNFDRGQFVEPWACTFAPDGRHFTVAGMGSKNIEIFTMDADVDKIAHQRLLLGHLSFINGTSWAPDSIRMASASMDGTVKIWDTANLVTPCLKTLAGHTHSVNTVAWSPDSSFIASGSSDKTVKIWDVNTGIAKQTCAGHGEAITAVVISPDSRLVFSASIDRTIKVWEASTGTCLQTLTGHDGPIEALAISSDGKVLLSGSQDKTIKSWSVGKYAKATK